MKKWNIVCTEQPKIYTMFDSFRVLCAGHIVSIAGTSYDDIPDYAKYGIGILVTDDVDVDQFNVIIELGIPSVAAARRLIKTNWTPQLELDL